MSKTLKARVVVTTGEDSTRLYRVVEGTGKNQRPCGEDRRPSDGGGFMDRAGAEGLARAINARRARKA